MTRLVRSLAAAALAVAALAAAPARAGHDCDRPAPPPPARRVYVPPPAPPPPVRIEHRGHRRELLREYRRLEHAREKFYARWNGNPREQRRFERWYDQRRAELDRAWYGRAAVARVELEFR